MPIQPNTAEDIYVDLRGRLRDKIDDLTNFTTNSVNYVWTREGFAEHLHEYEAALVAAQLSAWPEYAGGPIEESDLNNLEISGVDAADVDAYVEDADLDRLARINGVERDPGSNATGVVEFTVSDSGAEVPSGTTVSTEPDSTGSYLSYQTVGDVTPDSGSTTVEATIEAEAVGPDYNVGSNTVTHLPSPPSGVNEVNNPDPVGGASLTDTNGEQLVEGQSEEDNEGLRDRLQNAAVRQSGGGTPDGIEGYLTSNVDNVTSAFVVEEFDGDSEHGSYPHAHVVVRGGTDDDVTSAIEASKPAGVEHILERPIAYSIDVDATVIGDEDLIDEETAESDLETHIDELDLGEDVYRDRIIQTTLNAETDVEYIDTLDLVIADETHTYTSGTDIYTVNKGPYVSGSVADVRDENDNNYTEGIDYAEVNDDGIDFSNSDDPPSDGVEFYVTYELDGNISINETELASSGDVTVTVA